MIFSENRLPLFRIMLRRIGVRTHLIVEHIGSRDMMTPAKGGKAIAAAIADCRVSLIEGAGHMLMSERPDDVLAALRA